MAVTNLRVMAPGQTRTRKVRNPNFPVAGIMKPFGLYPIMIHPVLPGETAQFFSSKLRAISKPVKHPLAGAWLEHWLVYVKFTDIDRGLADMFVTDSFSTSGHTIGADNARYFAKSGQIDWVGKCVRRIHEAYFMHDNEAAQTIDGVPLIKLNASSWYENCIYEEAATVPNAASVATLEGQLTAYEMMRQMAMTELTYERYLEQYGVRSVREGIGEPEILRYARSWVMPANTVEPTTGQPSSAWVWSDEIKLDKPKLFSEPGFVVQLAAIRPKMYAKNIQSSMVGTLWGFSDFFPAYNLDDPLAGIKKIVAADGVVTGQTAQILFDQRDLLMNGEQFINAADASMPYAVPKATVPNLIASQEPESLRGEYPTSADVDALFTGAGATDKVVYYEGMSTIRINGHVVDFT